VKNENHGLAKLGGVNTLKYLQSDVGNVWEQNGWFLAKFGDFCILA